MSQEFEAIYENGVLRPLKPVELREHEVVTVSVSTTAGSDTVANEITRQRDVLLAFAAKMEATVDTQPTADFTNRDHDRVLYGDSI